jgi:hypothetical protein
MIASIASILSYGPKAFVTLSADRFPLIEVLQLLVRNSGTAVIDPEQNPCRRHKSLGKAHDQQWAIRLHFKIFLAKN